MISSPDPLNDSPTFQSPPRPRRSARTHHSLASDGSSPKKQTFQLDVGSQLSPQKIRVTVEAEGSGIENRYDGSRLQTSKASRYQVERTTTTTIPLKGLSDSEAENQAISPKKGRGRPRNLTGTPLAVKRRGSASTTTQKTSSRQRSIGSLIDGDDDEDLDFHVGKDVQVGRGRGRSRSRSTKDSLERSKPETAPGVLLEKPASSIAKSKRKSTDRRKSLVSENVVLQEASIGTDVRPGIARGGRTNRPAALAISDSLGDPFGGSPPLATGSQKLQDDRISQPQSSVTQPHPYPSRKKVSISRGSGNSTSDLFQDPCHRDEALLRLEDDAIEEEIEESGAIGTMREFDTILESEEFSMISVDSVPSLREHLSSPADFVQRVHSQAYEKSLLGSKQNDTHENSLQTMPKDIQAPAVPARDTRKSKFSALQQASLHESFSSIPPEVLEAATPAKKSLAVKLLSRKVSQNSLVENSFSSIPPEILEAATPAKPSLANTSRKEIEIGSRDQPKVSPNSPSDHVVDSPTRHKPISTNDKLIVLNEQSASSRSIDPISTRLLTPDETPSPTPGICNSPKQAHLREQESPAVNQHKIQDSSFAFSHIQSSPPSIAPSRFTYTAHLRQHRQLNPHAQTPSIVFSSPLLPPPINVDTSQTRSSHQQPRAALSPILRAGQVLQNITVPSSSRSRSESLGSPFKSPVSQRKSSSIHVDNHESSLQSGTQAHDCQMPNSNTPLPSLKVLENLNDDPFSYDRTSTSLERNKHHGSDLPRFQRAANYRLGAHGSYEKSFHSDSGMSWQAKRENPIESGINNNIHDNHGSQSSQSSLGQQWARGRAEVPKQVQAAASPNVITISSDDEEQEQTEEGEEDFGLLLESLNSSSPVSPPQQETLKDISERPRRSKIPSPWRNQSKRIVHTDEASRPASAPNVHNISTIHGQATQNSMDPVTVRRIVVPEINDDSEADLSGWQIPQKSNFQPRVRENTNHDISALLTASPLKILPTLSGQSNGLPQSNPKPIESSAAQDNSSEQDQDFRRPSGLTPIPQKAGFNPRPRSNSASPEKQDSCFPSIFRGLSKEEKTSSSRTRPITLEIAMPLANVSPREINTVPRRLSFSNPFSPSSATEGISENPDEKENRAITNARTAKWTESLKEISYPSISPPAIASQSSPSKSCLRSPLKAPPATAAIVATPGKGVTFVSSSPIPPSPMEPTRLSATTWSKSHCQLLESIVKSWKPEPTTTPSSPNSSSSASSSAASSNSNANSHSSSTEDRRGEYATGDKRPRRRNSTRVISRLLGRKVRSQGEEMRLEQWHLEAVDEFRGVVPGWEEKVVAMRVFALIVGERQREEKRVKAR